jgi:hypothetical protein
MVAIENKPDEKQFWLACDKQVFLDLVIPCLDPKAKLPEKLDKSAQEKVETLKRYIVIRKVKFDDIDDDEPQQTPSLGM